MRGQRCQVRNVFRIVVDVLVPSQIYQSFIDELTNCSVLLLYWEFEVVLFEPMGVYLIVAF